VIISHGMDFRSLYAHLSKVFVRKDQFVKRGQMIALSGASNSFGKPSYQHHMDYSAYSQKEITLPVACGDYGKALIAESKRKD
jgi:murein DD-endopeptidase MepM/ murein hydrolase activator NlpD